MPEQRSEDGAEAAGPPLVVACGALARELRAVLGQLGAGGAEVRFLPANLHNRPERIVPALDAALSSVGADRQIVVAYADCGTGGALDRWLAARPRARRLPGAHCYELFAGADRFAELSDEEPGTFWLTDFLAKHFDALVWEGLGLDRHPELLATYFAHYRRVVLISQDDDPGLVAAGERAARRLGLAFEHRHVGTGAFDTAVAVALRAPAPAAAG